MKKIFLSVAFIIINLHFAYANPSFQIDKEQFIPVSTVEVINYLTTHNFKLIHALQTPDSLVLATTKDPDITIFVHSKSSFSYINAISVTVLLTPYSHDLDTNANLDALNILTAKTFETVAQSLAFLPCANQSGFLRNGFVCPNQYKVRYSLYQGGLNEIRTWLGFTPDKQIIININPLITQSSTSTLHENSTPSAISTTNTTKTTTVPPTTVTTKH